MKLLYVFLTISSAKFHSSDPWLIHYGKIRWSEITLLDLPTPEQEYWLSRGQMEFICSEFISVITLTPDTTVTVLWTISDFLKVFFKCRKKFVHMRWWRQQVSYQVVHCTWFYAFGAIPVGNDAWLTCFRNKMEWFKSGKMMHMLRRLPRNR